jgi:predicted DNA repair protein MutK
VSSGLIALLDDVTTLAKAAVATLDDVAVHAGKAGTKAAGIVVDDAAVTPRWVVGSAANRELPIVAKIAVGSLKNKFLILLPAALLMSYVAPWAITPLLMLGGAYLCQEGAHKVYEALWPGAEPHGPGGVLVEQAADPAALEAEKVRSAVRTDFILSAEIMAITLSSVAEDSDSLLTQALVLAVVALGVTVGIYGAVALIVKADDAGLALAGTTSAPARALGRGLVKSMPKLLALLSGVGTLAMLWVGGGIIVHGLAVLGAHAPERWILGLAERAALASPVAGGLAGWLVGATLSGVLGLALGAPILAFVRKVSALRASD